MAKTKVGGEFEDFDGLDISKDIAGDLFWGSSEALKKELISTGIPVLDKILGGGTRRGSFIHVYGDWSTGKTFFAQLCMKSFQEQGYRVALIDAERSYTPEWYEANGIDTTKLIVTQPLTGERAADIAAELVRQGIDLVVIDSLATLMPTAEDEKSVSESVMGRQAMLINRLLRKVTAVNKRSVVIGINQTRTAMGVMYGDPTTTPGGKAPGFYSTQVIRMKRSGWITEKINGEQKRVGHNMTFAIEKNKNGNPWQECTIPFIYGKGLSMIHVIIDLGIQSGILGTKGGGYFLYKGENIARGREALAEWLELNPDVQELILNSDVSFDSDRDEEELEL